MKIEVIGKNGFNPSAANREYAEKKLKKLNDFFGEDNPINYHIEVLTKKYLDEFINSSKELNNTNEKEIKLPSNF